MRNLFTKNLERFLFSCVFVVCLFVCFPILCSVNMKDMDTRAHAHTHVHTRVFNRKTGFLSRSLSFCNEW